MELLGSQVLNIDKVSETELEITTIYEAYNFI